jgi:hypothetical protein
VEDRNQGRQVNFSGVRYSQLEVDVLKLHQAAVPFVWATAGAGVLMR